ADVHITSCKCCGKYFPYYGKKKYEYCDNKLEHSYKSCRDMKSNVTTNFKIKIQTQITSTLKSNPLEKQEGCFCIICTKICTKITVVLCKRENFSKTTRKIGKAKGQML
ncbi:MAG: hypothetical protein LBM93_14230, partial [Oscillospiraceae bacterium]|nr:hypothetical protein [Oscillospiraceae bacterium]